MDNAKLWDSCPDCGERWNILLQGKCSKYYEHLAAKNGGKILVDDTFTRRLMERAKKEGPASPPPSA